MFIKFICKNCGNYFEKTHDEIVQSKQSFRFCALCGHKLEVKNLKEIVQHDTKIDIQNKITAYLNELGIEGCIELVERSQNHPCYHMFVDELKSRGLWLQ